MLLFTTAVLFCDVVLLHPSPLQSSKEDFNSQHCVYIFR